ncbi:hypothetical protein [Paucibacter sp. M5-1]|uniref:hypothetical protein n=1 Tax=Paucibacter sp. M5-1 TaxID=3015998 RepID=UPI0022B887A3|nr:hypothetical protein [Paucibacter sp. M5-1]MCZ7881560.1 hypothetical protein [Paucibacter sp. M5-1]
MRNLQLLRSNGMPKCDFDPVLQDQLKRYVSERMLSVRAAAAELDVEHSVLSRFIKLGKARADTKARFRAALRERATETATAVAVSADSATGVRQLIRGDVLAERELRQIRSACESVLRLVDAYEAQLAGKI